MPLPTRPLNEKYRRQHDWGGVVVKGSMVRFATANQIDAIYRNLRRLYLDPIEVWKIYFDEDYDSNGFEAISMEAAAIITKDLLKWNTERAMMAKIQRTEQEQHDWEIYPDGKL